MKLAFVWKWGSGKTTLTSFFIKFLLENNKKLIVADADINVWLADSLWIKTQKEKYISNEKISVEMKQYLIWENKRIEAPSHFVKTTPPGTGSNIISFDSNDFFKRFCSYQDSRLKFFHVGTYEQEDIGISCYHTSLSILENLLSHTYTGEDEFVIADMVAGNDAFSNTLHSQFDAIFLIIEPTKESIEMSKHFLKLSQESTTSPIFLIANKVEDEDDLNYIKETFSEVFASISYEKSVKKQRRTGQLDLTETKKREMKNLFNKIKKDIKKDHDKILENLHSLHKKYKELDYIKVPLGDLIKQIDLDFSFKKYAKNKKK